MRSPSPSDFDKLVSVAEANVFWSGGLEFPWQGDTLTTPSFIEALLNLAVYAPKQQREAFIRTYGDPE